MSKATLLVVEDELIIALSIQKSLEKIGYTVIGTASTGEDAVRKALELRPDLVLIDIILAGAMDGISAARAIREQSDIPVIYLTANADRATVEKARDTLPYGYLNKPINERDLMTNIDSALHMHRVERRLRESEEKYRSLIENISDIIVSTDDTGTITFASTQVTEIAGYDQSEVIGKNFINFIYPEDREKVIATFKESKSGRKAGASYRIISKSGGIIWLRSSGRPSFIDGRFSGVKVILSDITDRKKAEENVQRVNEELEAANEELHSINEELEATNEEFEAQNRELVRAQEELESREAMLQSIFRAAPVGIGIVVKRVLGWTNPYLHEMIGYKEEELRGRSARMLYPTDEDFEYVGREKYRQIGISGSGSVETRWKRKDGTVINIILSSTPIDLNNLDAGVVFSALDITERKQAEEALRVSEEKYRHLAENISDNVWVLDIKSMKLMYNNPYGSRIIGYSPEEAVNLELSDIIAPDSLDMVNRTFQEELERDGKPDVDPDRTGAMEVRQIRKDGSLVWVEMKVKFLRDAGGRPVSILGVSRDITERKRTLDELTHREEVFRKIIEDSPLPVSIVDESTGTFTYVNKSYTKLLGYTIDDHPNMNAWWEHAYPDPEYRKKNRVLWEKAVAYAHRTGTGVRSYEVDVQCRDGNYRHLEYWMAPIGNLSMYVTIDQTDKKIQQEIMIQTEKMMSLGGLAAGMAHEINNPLGIILQGIQGTLNRVSRDVEQNRVAAEKLGIDLDKLVSYLEQRDIIEYLNGMRDAAQRAARIVANMLRFSRQSNDIRPVDINMLLDKIVEIAENDYDLKNKFDFKKILIKREYDPKLPPVPCSETGIGQVVLNLLKNSSHALWTLKDPGYQPVITLRTALNGGHAVIDVADNGPGMDKKMQRHIFEPFYTTKGIGKGTGLGLSVSYYIVTENHHGSISVSSKPGKGAVFTIKIPLEYKR